MLGILQFGARAVGLCGTTIAPTLVLMNVPVKLLSRASRTVQEYLS